MVSHRRVAILSPVAWRTPPRQYGAWETVAGNIAEGLVERGWDVTLFATGDSLTRAHLHAVVERGYEEDRSIDPKVAEYLHIAELFEHAAEFDLIHSHYDFMALAYTRLVKTPVLTTIHGFSSPRIMPVYEKYRDGYFVSISNSDRVAGLNYLATVYNGIDLALYPQRETRGEDLIFIGRIHPDKGVHLAIETARRSGRRLLIAGIVQDKTYFQDEIQPHLDDKQIMLCGAGGRGGEECPFRTSLRPASSEYHPGTIWAGTGGGERGGSSGDRNGSWLLRRGHRAGCDWVSGNRCGRGGESARRGACDRRQSLQRESTRKVFYRDDG